MAHVKVAKEQWARMSEDWMAEETGVRPKRQVSVPEVAFYDENAMETDDGDDIDIDLDIDASYADLKPPESDSQRSEEDLGLAYGVHRKFDPRPTICYDELVEPSPPVVPREVAKRFKVRVNFEDDESPKPSIKSRLGITQVDARRENVFPSSASIKDRLGGMNLSQAKREDGELSDEDSEDDNIKDNLEGRAWTKRLIGPRMKMYADEEVEKKSNQDTKTRLYNNHDSHRERSKSRDHLKRIQPSGLQFRKNHLVARKPRDHYDVDYSDDRTRISSRRLVDEYEDEGLRRQRRYYENHDSRTLGVSRRNYRHENHDSRSLGVSRRSRDYDDEDQELPRVSRRISIKDRLGSRVDRVRR